LAKQKFRSTGVKSLEDIGSLENAAPEKGAQEKGSAANASLAAGKVPRAWELGEIYDERMMLEWRNRTKIELMGKVDKFHWVLARMKKDESLPAKILLELIDFEKITAVEMPGVLAKIRANLAAETMGRQEYALERLVRIAVKSAITDYGVCAFFERVLSSDASEECKGFALAEIAYVDGAHGMARVQKLCAGNGTLWLWFSLTDNLDTRTMTGQERAVLKEMLTSAFGHVFPPQGERMNIGEEKLALRSVLRRRPEYIGLEFERVLTEWTARAPEARIRGLEYLLRELRETKHWKPNVSPLEALIPKLKQSFLVDRRMERNMKQNGAAAQTTGANGKLKATTG